ncbi:autotransporter domain-containing protein [Aquabacter sp. CN5-332]|uniref:autotransporter outer membrane beta-barrel domain-containing protein n=1 Tax=Aquabacter sp. CN5-332 TaxID=3156608 RepID=UPI0032B606F2
MTTISAGTLTLSGTGSIASSASVVVNGAFNIGLLSGPGTTVKNLWGGSAGGVVALGDKTLTVVEQTGFLDYAGSLTGTGTLIKQGTESLTLSGNSSAFAGTTQVDQGTLFVSNHGGTSAGVLGGNVTVASGATLEGVGGTIGRTVSVAAGGTLGWTTQGSNIGGLTMGFLTMDAGAITTINLLSPVPAGSIFTVAGNATVNGTLNLESAPGNGAGVYRVFSTGGTLTNAGMVLGQTPTGYSFQIDTQATTLDVVATTLDTSVQYWSADGTTRGGGGNWTSANPWLGVNGGYAPWAGQVGVFDGTPGIVMVDGTQGFGTLEFLTSGYQIQAGMAGVLDLGAGGRLWAEGEDIVVTVSAPITGTGALTKIGAGTIILSGTNTYQGGTVLQAGTLSIAADANLGAASGALTFTGGELETTASFTSARAVVLTSNGLINVGEDTTLTLTGSVSGAGGIVLGSGTLVLSGTNTYQGGTTLFASTLQVSSDANLGVASGGLTFNGGTLATTASFSSARAITLNAPTTISGDPIPGNGTFDTAAGTALTLSGVVSGAGALIKAGAGTLVLAGANTYTGTTTINSGTLALSGAGSIAASSGVVANGTFDISGTSAGASIQGLTGSGAVTLGGQTLTLSNASGTFSGIIGGSGGLTLSGGTQTLSGANTYTGATTITGGTLALSGAGSIAASSGVVANGTFDISGTTSGASIQSLSGTGGVALGGQTLTLTNASGTFSGVISGSGALVLAGGSQTLTGANSYTGGTTVSSGMLVLGSSRAAGTGAISLAGGTTLGFASGISVANAIALGGNVTFDLASGSATASGALTGTGAVTYTGGGLISLTGDSSAFAGTTTVDGTLSVNGTLGGSVNVLSGGTLKGNGTVGATTIASGGTIAPGNSIGTLTVNGPLTFASGSTYAVEINPQGQSDRIAVTGSATLNGATVSVTKAPGSYLPGTSYTILTAQGGVAGTFGPLTQDLPFINLALSYAPTDVTLNVVRNQVSFPNVAVTANQVATAGAVEALGQGNALYNAVVSQTSVAGAQQAFNALDGEVYPSALSIFQNESLILRRAVLDRARVPVAAPGAAPLAYAGGTDVVAVPGTPNAFWAQGFGAWGQIDGNGNAATISGNTSGVFVGYDRTFSPGLGDWRLGFAAGYSSSSYQVDARNSSFSSDNAHVALYGGGTVGAWGLRFGGAYSWADMSVSRSVVFPGLFNQLSADTTARTGQVFGEVSYGLSFASVGLEPFAGLAYVNVDLDDFSETGGPSALTSSGASEGVTYSTLGARVSVPLALGTIATSFKGTLAWQHAFGDTAPEALFAFGPGAQPFAISGVPIASDAALVEAGLDMAFTANTTLSVFYAGQLASTDTSNMVKGSFAIRF